jgi:FkbM family methyltransferase
MTRAAAFGFAGVDRRRLAWFHVQTALSRRIRLVPSPSPIRVALAPDGHEVLISDPGELAALGHIFNDDEYRASGTPDVIFDLGANVGFATLYFSRCFPQARIVSVEADPRTYARLCQNVSALPNVTPLNLAVTHADGPVPFHSSPYSLWSGLTAQSTGTVEITVEGITLSTLMARTHVKRVGLLKLDIEGAEFALLRTHALGAVDEIVGEIHFDLVTDVAESQLNAELCEFTTKFVPQMNPERSFLYACRRRPPEP